MTGIATIAASSTYSTLCLPPRRLPADGRCLPSWRRPNQNHTRLISMPTPAVMKTTLYVGQLRRAAEHVLGHPAGQQRREHRTEVDAHVEDGEARVAAFVGGRVELADHRRDVRLEQAVARDDRRQADLEDRLVRPGDHEQAGRHDHRAEQDRSLVAEDLVGDIAAEDRRGVHQRQVRAVDAVGRRFARARRRHRTAHDVQHQRPADAVEREALPELRHEQHPQRRGMPHDLSEFRNGRARARCRR